MTLFLPKHISLNKPLLILLTVCLFQWTACSLPSDVFEKNVAIPGQQWESSFRPVIDFTIQPEDTSSRYNVYLVLRHTDAYNFNNIWIKATVLQPGDTTVHSERYDLLLATNDKGWLGSGMDDIYEHRVQIQQQTRFARPGKYSITLEQIMREDPLKHILNVGVRIEKVK